MGVTKLTPTQEAILKKWRETPVQLVLTPTDEDADAERD